MKTNPAKKKFLHSIIIALSICNLSYSQQPELDWALKTGGSSSAKGSVIVTDANGELYVAGTFNGTVDFDPSDAGIYNLTSPDNQWGGHAFSVYIAKFSADGVLVWAKKIGNPIDYDPSADAIALDGKSNVYIAGTFFNTVDFDPGSGIYNLSASHSSDCFLLKLDRDGNFTWAENTCSGHESATCQSVKIDGSGSIYMTGLFWSPTDFDPDPDSIFNLSGGGYSNPYVLKLDAAGNFLWVRHFSAGSYNQGAAIDVDATGNVYATGNFSYPCNFNPGGNAFVISPVFLDSDDYSTKYDVYVAKLDPGGNLAWAKSLGGTVGDFGRCIKADNQGNCVVGGVFSGTADFNPDASLVFNLSSSGSTDVFMCKLNSSGEFVWAEKMGGTLADDIKKLEIDNAGNIYSVGNFNGTCDFDPSPAEAFNITSAGGQDVYISRLDADGNFVWAKSFGGPDTPFGNSDSGEAICLTPNASALYATGWFDGQSDFDPTDSAYNLTADGPEYGTQNIFILRWNIAEPLHINENKNGRAAVFPNPFNGSFNILLEETSDIEIYNTTGRRVFKQAFEKGIHTINLHGIANGFYVLQCLGSKTSYTQKIVKEN